VAPHPEQYSGQLRWSRLRQDVAIVLWPSFLVAALATMFGFAFVDPVLLGHDDYPPPGFANRQTGYAIGFFFFWVACALASLLTLYLARTAAGPPSEPKGESSGDETGRERSDP
jgi:hypothetical protein